jgi:glycosyltransferase involved in cell wall biosynthesis
MRLGFFLLGDLSTRTGGFLYDRMLIEGLEQRGADIEVIQLPWRSYANLLIASLLHRDLHRLTENTYDLIIQDELAHPSLFTANSFIKKHSKTPVISIVHHLRSSEGHSGPLIALYRWIESIYLNTLDGCIVNSPATLGEVESVLKQNLPTVIAPPGRDHLVVNITEGEIRNRANKRGPFEILFLGSIIPRKRLGDLVTAIGRLSNLDIRLTVIGRDTSAPGYVRQVRSDLASSLPEHNVRWLGEQTDEQVIKALQRAHLLVVPSSYEGFGIAYLDAMGYGVVPIGTNTGGAGAIIDHGNNGFLISPDDLNSLTGFIDRLSTDRELLERMAIQAFRHHHQHPTWEEVTGIVYDYINANFVRKDAPN